MHCADFSFSASLECTKNQISTTHGISLTQSQSLNHQISGIHKQRPCGELGPHVLPSGFPRPHERIPSQKTERCHVRRSEGREGAENRQGGRARPGQQQEQRLWLWLRKELKGAQMGWAELGWDQMGDGRRKENAADASASTTEFSHCGEHDSRYSIQQIESLAPLLLLLCTRSLAHSLDSSLSLSPSLPHSLTLAGCRSVGLSVCVCVCLSVLGSRSSSFLASLRAFAWPGRLRLLYLRRWPQPRAKI